MKNTFQKKLYENGYLIIKNVLNFERDLKPVLNDMEFVMDCLIQKYTKKKRLKKFLISILEKNILLFQNLISMIWINILIQDYQETT